MVQSAEISPAGAGAVTIERTSHVVETDGSVYDMYRLTATAAQGFVFDRFEVRYLHTYDDTPAEYEDATYAANPFNFLPEQVQTPDYGGHYHNIEVVGIVAYFHSKTGKYDGILRNEGGTILRNASGVVLIGAEYRP